MDSSVFDFVRMILAVKIYSSIAVDFALFSMTDLRKFPFEEIRRHEWLVSCR
jgi:hypothetical protein